MAPARGELTLETRLMPEEGLWRWDILDAAGGGVVESSWTGQWTGYRSREEALRAGLARLVGFTRLSRVGRPRRLDDLGREGTGDPRRVLIVPRTSIELYHSLKRSFADNSRVEVVLDRRFSQRRTIGQPIPDERRRADRRRRGDVAAALRSGRWAMVVPTHADAARRSTA